MAGVFQSYSYPISAYLPPIALCSQRDSPTFCKKGEMISFSFYLSQQIQIKNSTNSQQIEEIVITIYVGSKGYNTGDLLPTIQAAPEVLWLSSLSMPRTMQSDLL